MIEKALNLYYGQRCGSDVPGVHHVCHEDWQGTRDGQTKMINGGWHDAGDIPRARSAMAALPIPCCRSTSYGRKVIQPELQARALEEARWGLDWLLKTRFGQGYRIAWARMRYYTDNKVGTGEDIIAPALHVAYENFLFSAVAAYAPRVLKTVDPQRAADSLKAAEEDYAATLQQHPD